MPMQYGTHETHCKGVLARSILLYMSSRPARPELGAHAACAGACGIGSLGAPTEAELP